MLGQLVALLVFVSLINPGRLELAENEVRRMINIVEELVPFMKDIKSTMNYQESNLTSFNNSILQLRAQLEEHKNQTAEELAELQISFNNSILQLRAQLEEHKSQTAVELAELQTSVDNSLSFLTAQLNDKLESLNTSLTAELISLNSSLTAELISLNSSLTNMNKTLDTIKTELKAHDINLSTHHLQTENGFDQLQTYIQNNLTHQLENINDHIEQQAVYSCRGTGGWRRVVYLDMTDTTNNCPSGWQLTGYSNRTCGRVNVGGSTCDSATFPVSGGEYRRVCGRIKAYQYYSTNAFERYNRIIDDVYVDGVSLTHGSPRQHIWTFAAGVSEQYTNTDYLCPCDTDAEVQVPSFVGNYYFCESGNPVGRSRSILYSNDTLWDGENCGSSSTCCSLNNPPYFYRYLSSTVTDDLEVRICLDQSSSNEDIAVELVELYVR